MKLNLRAGRPEDAEICGEICFEAFKSISGKHNFPWDFPSAEAGIGLMNYALSRDDVYSVIAEMDGKIIGSNFLWEGNQVAGVGPITVNPEVQNSAVGKQLMEDVLRRAEERDFLSVRLCQAAYHNRSLALYTKLGFDTCEPLSVMQGTPLNLRIEGYNVRPSAESDVEACNQLCFRVHGHTRNQDVIDGIRMGSGTVVERSGRITGYSTGVGFMGHSVGETSEDLMALIGNANEFQGPGFLLPTRNSELMRWCLKNELKIVMPMTLMSRGLYQEPKGAFLPSVLY